MDTRIPVTIITGFLGAGKTTLLNNLINKHFNKKFAIIENEFGEIGIDGGLIIGADENIFELANGCICCSLNDELMVVLNKLLDSEHVFNHLLIETTGIADPMTIVKAFVADEKLQDQWVLDSVVCLADAANMEDLIKTEMEVHKQLALSDVILLNKIDTVTTIYAEKLAKMISEINPMAKVFPVSFAKIEDIELLDTRAYSAKEIEKSTLLFRNLSVSEMPNVQQQSSIISKQRINYQHNITSEGFAFPGNLDLDKFSTFMQSFLFFNQNTIFRVKAILSFANISERYIFHSVRGTYMFELGKSWDKDQRFNKIVFIGKHINREELEESLYQLLEK